MITLNLARSLCVAFTGMALATSPLPAMAGFVSDITVRLIAPGGFEGDPTPISEQQVVTVANLATGLQAGSAGPISGTWMLASEEITFVGESIRVRSFAGYDDFSSGGTSITTGYLGSGGSHARYEFDGLSITGKTITGFTVSAFDNYADSGFVGLTSPSAASLVHLIDADTISLDLDSILFVNRGGGTSLANAFFRIDLITRDNGTDPGNRIPEPATLALVLAAALGAGAVRRRA